MKLLKTVTAEQAGGSFRPIWIRFGASNIEGHAKSARNARKGMPRKLHWGMPEAAGMAAETAYYTVRMNKRCRPLTVV